MQLKIKIAGVDLTLSVRADSVLIDNIINKRIDICKLLVEDTTGSIVISNWDELIISNTGETIRYFAGYIVNVDPLVGGITKLFSCQAEDYTLLLDRTITANKLYEDKTDAYILNDLFATYLSEVDATTYVSTGRTHDKIVLNRMTLREVVDRLASEAGFDWYLDYNKKLHFFAIDTNMAPFDISDNPDGSATYAAELMKYRKAHTDPVNRVVVVGGDYLSDNVTFYLPNNNVTTEILMPYRAKAPVGETSILVWHNTNTDGAPNWVADVIGIDHIDAFVGGVTVLHNYQEKLLKFDTAPSNLNLAVKITIRYEVPVLLRCRSNLSYATYGRWFDGKIVDKNLTSREAATLAGKALLARKAFVRETGTYQVSDRDGLVAGQRQNIVDTLRGINGNYMINRVTTSILGGDKCLYKVYFGEYNPDLVDLLVALKAAAVQHEDIRDDEVLNELFEQLEELSMVETTDYHADAAPLTGRWIAEPAVQGVGHHVRHDELALTETTDYTPELTERYKWG